MKKVTTFLFSCLMLLCLGMGSALAQTPCTQSPLGSYTVANLTTITGAPNPVCGAGPASYSSTAYQAGGGSFDWQVWGGESYRLGFIQGNTYTISICDGTGAWDEQITIQAPSGAVEEVTNDCTITFSANESGTYVVFITAEGQCGSADAALETNNGHFVVSFAAGAATACAPPTCGNGTCDAGENFGTCTQDCPCVSAFSFLTWPDLSLATTPSIYCPEQLSGTVGGGTYNGGTNEDPAVVYVPFIIDSENELVSTPADNNDPYGTLTTSGGSLYASTSPPSPNANGEATRFIHFLKVNQADIDAGTTTTITFTGDNSACSSTVIIDWSTIANANDIATQCGGVTPCNSNIPSFTPSAITVESGQDIVIPMPAGTTEGGASTIDLFAIYNVDSDITDLATEGFTTLQQAWEAAALPFADILGGAFDGTNLVAPGFNNAGTAPVTITLYIGIYTDPTNSYTMDPDCPYYAVQVTINPLPPCDSTIPDFTPAAITVESGQDIVVELPAGTIEGPASTIDLFVVIDANNQISDLATEGFPTLQPAWEALDLPWAVNLDAVLTGTTLTAAGFNNPGPDPVTVTLYVGVYTDPVGDFIMNPICPYYPVQVTINPLPPCDSTIPDFTPAAITVESGQDIVVELPAGTIEGPASTIDLFVVVDANNQISDLATEGFPTLQPAWEALDLPWAVNLDAVLTGTTLTGAGFNNPGPDPVTITLYVGVYTDPVGDFIMNPLCPYYPVQVTINPIPPCDSSIPDAFPAALTLDSEENIVLTLPNGTVNGTSTTIDLFIVVNDAGVSDLATEGFATLEEAWETTTLPYAVQLNSVIDGNTLTATGFLNDGPDPVTFTVYIGAYTNPLNSYTMQPECPYYPIELTINPAPVAEVCPVLSNFTSSAGAVCSDAAVTLCADLAPGTYPEASIVFHDGNGNTYNGTASGGGSVTHTVQVSNFQFSPATINAQVGDIIVWNHAGGSHTTTCDPVEDPATSLPAGAATWNAPITSGNTSFSYTLTVPGTYTYTCLPHSPSGGGNMVATINVAPAVVTYCADVTLTATGCTPIAKTFTAAVINAGTCTIADLAPQSVNVFPPITAQANAAVNCGAGITVGGGCNNYVVSYTTSNGGTGTGASFTLTPNATDQSGTATFTVSNSDAPVGCNSTQVQVAYSCPAQVCAELDGNQSAGPASLCSGQTATLTYGAVIDNSFPGGAIAWSYSTTDMNFDPYTAGIPYVGQALSASGCTPTTYYLKARLTDVATCQDASSTFVIAVYPPIVLQAVNGTCSAGVNIVGGCNYDVSYTTSGGQTGTGASVTLTQELTEQIGTVSFTVTNSQVPQGTCASATITANYNCPALVCSELDGNQDVSTSAICSGDAISASAGGVTNNSFTGGMVAVKYDTNMNFDPYTSGTAFSGSLPVNNSCNTQTYYVKFYLTGVAQCQDVSDAFEVVVYPNISASVSDSDPETCSPATLSGLSVDCGFAITWEDSFGATGTGSNYQPADGAVGFVSFTINNLSGAPLACQEADFTASYNCSDLVCSALDDNQNASPNAICSGQALTLTNGAVVNNDFTGGTVTWVYSTSSASFNPYNAGTVFTGSLPANTTCSAVTYFVKARLDGVTGCVDQSAAFTVMVYPAISATATNGTCSASVTVNCPGFDVTWDNGSSSGSGTTYTPVAGEAGSVIFTVTQADAPAACASTTATASFDCPLIQCSELDGNQTVSTSSICSGASVDFVSGGVIDNSFSGGTVTWVYGTAAGFDAYADGTAFNGTLPENNGCDAMIYYIKARLDGVEDCQDVSDEFEVTVYAPVNATIMSSECSAMVMSNCNYDITWNNGTQTGSGASYSAQPGEAALVIFTVSRAGSPASCASTTLFADLNCPEEIECQLNEAGVCILSLLHGRLDICAGDGVQATAEGAQVNDPNYSQGFILYESPDGTLDHPDAEILEYSASGAFINDGDYPTGVTLFICSAVLRSPFGSTMEGGCRHFSEGQDVSFLTPLSATASEPTCNFDDDTYSVELSIQGGSGEYSVNGMPINGDTYTATFANGNSYELAVQDEAGCTDLVEGSYTCVLPPAPPAAENATYTISINAGAANYNLNDYSSDPNGDVLTFSLGSILPEGLANVELDPITGELTFTPLTSSIGQTIEVEYFVSDGQFTTSATLSITVTDLLSCELLDPIDVQVAVTYSANIYSVYVFVNGGISDIDGSDYNIEVSDGTNNFSLNAAAGQLLVVEDVQAPSSSFTLSVNATDAFGCTGSSSQLVDITLSVQLVNFVGEVRNEGNLLKWTTASETNNDHFTLQRSSNGSQFETITKINGAGNTSAVNSYNYTDRQAPAGLNYYRLLQTDFDGTTRNIGLVTLTRDRSNFAVTQLAPMPVSNELTVSYISAQTEGIVATIYDVTARIIETLNTSAQDGANQLHIDVSRYAAGTYFVSLNNGMEISVAKFVKQ